MNASRFDSIDAFLNSLDEVKAHTLRAIIEYILLEFPDLEAKIAWNVPHLHRDGQYVVGLSAAKKHLSFSPWSKDVMDTFRDRLEKDYKVTAQLFHIPVDWTIDQQLLNDLVNARLTELE